MTSSSDFVNKLSWTYKKTYFHLLRFQKEIKQLPLYPRIGIVSLLFIFLAYPGQNYYQTKVFNPQAPRVKASHVSIQEHPIPVLVGSPAPDLSARAAYVFDPDSGTVLFEKKANTRLLPASTTKIMTALVSLDTYSLSDVITITDGPQAIGNSLRLPTGAQFTVRDLLYALLVSSGNDVALTLAENHPQGYSGFVFKMNQKARQLGMTNTNYSNVSGIESIDHYSTVHDLAILTKHALHNALFSKIVSTENITISDVSNNNSYYLSTTNQLLGQIPGLKGVKTGWTQRAGECLVTFIDSDHRLITVVLGSQDRFGESKLLINWALNNHSWQTL